jgi:hypothetical protein
LLRRKFGTENEKVIRGCRKLHANELYVSYSLSGAVGYEVNKRGGHIESLRIIVHEFSFGNT